MACQIKYVWQYVVMYVGCMYRNTVARRSYLVDLVSPSPRSLCTIYEVVVLG